MKYFATASCTELPDLALRRAAAYLFLVLAGGHWPQSEAASARRAGDASLHSLVLTSSGAAAVSTARPARHGSHAGRARGRRLRPDAGGDAVGSAAALPAARHHIYRPGLTADSCDASTFPAGVG